MVRVILPPYYDGKKFVQEAVASVLDQSYRDLELVRVNDGSSPEESAYLRELVREKGDGRIKLREAERLVVGCPELWHQPQHRRPHHLSRSG